MNIIHDVVVIGAGQSGLATAYHLAQTQLDYIVLESAETVGGAWRHYYDSLKLFSPANYSSLPGLLLEGTDYLQRDEIVTYLETYAETFDFPIRTTAKVVSLTKHEDYFQSVLAGGETIQSRAIIVATGAFQNPNQPTLVGQKQFSGQLMHAAEYRYPEPFVGQRVVIVGGRNTAVQIGAELAKVADVTLATKVPISYVPQHIMGRDIHFWLTRIGFDQLPLGQWFKASLKEAVVDDGRYKAALDSNQPNRKPMFKQFTKDGVVWADGYSERVDTVIFATGYRPNLPFLQELDDLDDNNRPNQQGGVSTIVSGLFFVGLPWQRSHRSATLRGVGPDADYVVQRLQSYLLSSRQS